MNDYKLGFVELFSAFHSICFQWKEWNKLHNYRHPGCVCRAERERTVYYTDSQWKWAFIWRTFKKIIMKMLCAFQCYLKLWILTNIVSKIESYRLDLLIFLVFSLPNIKLKIRIFKNTLKMRMNKMTQLLQHIQIESMIYE